MPETGQQDTKNELFRVSKSDQVRTVDELFEKSQPSSTYYTFLTLSVFIVTSGLLFNNGFIVLGGMLVTPVLTPIFVVALGFSVGHMGAVRGASLLLLKSFALVVVGAILLAFVFGIPSDPFVFENTMRTALLYLTVAVASGMAATFAWVKKDNAEILPGVAIAVSVVPPMSLLGIALVSVNIELARFYLLVFLFNLVGVTIGSMVAFTMLKFYRSEREVQHESDEQAREAEKRKLEAEKK